jgi:hypothetical protein
MDGDDVVLRQSWWDLLVWFGPLVLLFVVFDIVVAWAAAPGDHGARWAFAAEILILVGSVLLRRRMRVVLSDADLTVVNFRRRVLPASEILGVQTVGGNPLLPLRVQILEGRRWFTLMSLTAGWPWQQAKIERRYHVVGQWWLDHQDSAVRSAP